MDHDWGAEIKLNGIELLIEVPTQKKSKWRERNEIVIKVWEINKGIDPNWGGRVRFKGIPVEIKVWTQRNQT